MAAWVPLFQTLAWVLLITVVLIYHPGALIRVINAFGQA